MLCCWEFLLLHTLGMLVTPLCLAVQQHVESLGSSVIYLYPTWIQWGSCCTYFVWQFPSRIWDWKDSGLTDLHDMGLHIICWHEFLWYFVASVICLATIWPLEFLVLELLIVPWYSAAVYSVLYILWDYSYRTMIVPEQVFVAEYHSYDYEMKSDQVYN